MASPRFKTVGEHVAELATMIRVDARTLRRAIEVGDTKKAHEIALHLCAVADELAPSPPVLVV